MRRFFRRSPPQQRVTPEKAPGSPKASRLNKSEDFESHSIKQLKKLCAERGIDFSKFVEKGNFVEALRDDDNNRQHAGGLAKAIRRGTDVRDEDVPLPRTYSDFAKSRATGVPLQSPPRKVPPSREMGSKLEDGKVFMAVGFDRQTGAIDVAPLRVCRIDANGDPGEDDLARQLNEALTRGRGPEVVAAADVDEWANDQKALDAAVASARIYVAGVALVFNLLQTSAYYVLFVASAARELLGKELLWNRGAVDMTDAGIGIAVAAAAAVATTASLRGDS